MTKAKILAIAAVLVSLPSLALAQTIVIVRLPPTLADMPSRMPADMLNRTTADIHTLSRTTVDIPTVGHTLDITPMPLRLRTLGMYPVMFMAGSAGKDKQREPQRGYC
jgi:hypothetical protein